MARNKKKNTKQTIVEKKEQGISLKRFALTYFLLMGAFFIPIGFYPIRNLIDVNGLYSHAIVAITVKILSLLGIASHSQGSVIQLFSISLDVKFGCNGLEAVMIYSAAVIAFPSSWKNKLIGVAMGFFVIQTINIFRIVGLAYSAVHASNFFEFIHTYIAQGMMIAISLGVFIIYLNYAKYTEKVA